jgi:replication-associated recombination protein RarA
MRKRSLQHWYPHRFDEIVGNDDLVSYGRELVQQVRIKGNFECDNAIIRGKSRTGKSSLVDLIKRCLSCYDFDFNSLTPCNGQCDACKSDTSLFGNFGWEYYPNLWDTKTPIFALIISVDCSSVDAKDFEEILDKVRYRSSEVFCLVHLEEVHWLAEKRLDQRLLVPLESYNAVWIATSAYVKVEDAPVRRQLNEMLLNRFPYRLTTSHPTADDLAIFAAERCVEFQIPSGRYTPEL